jgi:type II secretory pathway component PulK
VLILVLIVVSGMAVMSFGLSYRTRIEIQLSAANARRVQAYYVALGGIERIKALLSNHQPLDARNISAICRFDGTGKQEQLFEQFKDWSATGDKVLTYSLRDEQAYLNVNNSAPAAWENMGLDKETCASILDWVDADDDTGPGGAETDFYQGLERAYVSKNAPLITLKELLFVKSVTRTAYTGEYVNQLFSSGLRGDGEKLFAVGPDGDETGPHLGLVNIFTVYGDGKININTVSKRIVSALPGLIAAAAEAVLTHLAGRDGQIGTDDDNCFVQSEDLTQVEGLGDLEIELLQHYCNFDSTYFRAFSYARVARGYQCCLMATIRWDESGPAIISLERLL